MKLSINELCPCGSKQKYKKCCMPYHKGARAKDALTLMKSRYSAYARGQAEYIINTTHKKNTQYEENKVKWSEDIKDFYKQTEFLGLKILETDLKNTISFVTFKANMSSGDLTEKSRFIYEDGIWLYEKGEIL